MTRNLVELLGLLVIVIGVGLVVAAASYVGWALACLVAGVALVLAGGIAVFVVNVQPTATVPSERR